MLPGGLWVSIRETLRTWNMQRKCPGHQFVDMGYGWIVCRHCGKRAAASRKR